MKWNKMTPEEKSEARDEIFAKIYGLKRYSIGDLIEFRDGGFGIIAQLKKTEWGPKYRIRPCKDLPYNTRGVYPWVWFTGAEIKRKVKLSDTEDKNGQSGANSRRALGISQGCS